MTVRVVSFARRRSRSSTGCTASWIPSASGCLRCARSVAGERPRFVRAPEEFTVAPAPADLQDRRVEITGPVDRKMMINALNSGARVFMADFEDANSPSWENVVDGQRNVHDAVRRTIALDTGEKRYRLNEETATLVIRPRGWHLVERHHEVDGAPVSRRRCSTSASSSTTTRASSSSAGRGPYFYLPKLESHLEARSVGAGVRARRGASSGCRAGSIKCTVLIETILAAFEMDAILYELRDHSCALNAGPLGLHLQLHQEGGRGAARPCAGDDDGAVHALLHRSCSCKTCHAREAHAIGGMAAFIPSRRDPEVNEVALAKVREDKEREAGDGFDGTWVAHPDLVPVALAEFDAVLGDRPNQLERKRDDVDP